MLFVAFFVVSVHASQIDDVYVAPSSNRVELHTGYDVISMVGTHGGGSSQQPLGYTVGINYCREVWGHFGMSAGVDIVDRSFRLDESDQILRRNFTDFIYSLTHTQTTDFPGVSSVTTFLGGFAAVPPSADTGDKLPMRTSEGLYLSVSGRVPLDAPVDFGVNMWTKLGLTKAFGGETGFNRIFSSGIGISAIF